MSAIKPSSREFTGRHMLLLAVGFFGVIFAVNVGMATVAATSWTGLVVKNSYVAGQEFEAKRLAHNAQKAAGWVTALTLADGTITLQVTDKQGLPIELGMVRLDVNRPVGGHDDQSMLLERGDDGAYTSALALDPGVWDALIVATDTPLGPFELHQRITTSGTRK